MQDIQARRLIWLRIFQPFLKMFNVDGRASPQNMLGFLALGTLASCCAAGLEHSGRPYLEALSLCWSLLWMAPLPALFARRLHDQNRSARWAWLLLALPSLFVALVLLPQGTGGTATFLSFHASPQSGLTATLLQIIFALIIITLLGLTVYPGTPGENRYGQNPDRTTQPQPLT